jgi:hypothetical protein
MNCFRFSNFSSDASFPNNPSVGKIFVDPLEKKVFIYTGEQDFVEIREQAPQPHIPLMRIHSGTCPSCGGIVSPSASRCEFCGRYFE